MEMSKRSYGIAIIGYGGMGGQHARLIGTTEVMRLTGVWDIDPARLQAATEASIHAYADYASVLHDPDVEIVLIATPNHVHKELSIQALQAGKHVICEKPVTLNSQELEEILKVAEQTGKLFVVHQNRRWDEDYLSVKRIVDERRIGDLFYIETRVHGSRGIPGDWRKQKEFGGGMMLDWGVHLLDRLLLMIPEKVTRLYCQLFHVTGSEVDDGFKLLLTFESGKTALVEVGTTHFIALPKWYAAGTQGTAVIEDWEMNGRVVRLADQGSQDAQPIVAGAGFTKTMAPREDNSVTVEPLPRIQTDVRDFYRNVVEAIEGKAEIVVKNEQVLRVMRLIDAAMLSDRLRQVVPFEEI
jgi:predicted dehydrogenase